MKKISLFFCFFLSFFLFTCSDDDDKTISFSKLPSNAQEFISEHFSNESVRKITLDNNEYTVFLESGFEIEFFKDGNWKQVDGGTLPVPSSILAILPEGISSYVTKNYPDNYIVEVAVESYGYEIQLNTVPEKELKFDKNGNAIDHIVPVEQLPANAQSFLSKYFQNVIVTMVDKEDDGDWNVYLANGYEISFSNDGVFKSIDGAELSIPADLQQGILPVDLLSYLESQYSNYPVVEIDVTSYGFEIKLSDSTELKFDRKGNLLNNQIPVNQLPATSQLFIQTYYPSATVLFVNADDDGTYEAVLNNGINIIFTLTGEWKEIDAEKSGISASIVAALLPAKAVSYLSENYSSNFVIEMKVTVTGFQVELNTNSDIEIDFDKEGNYLSSIV